MKLPHDKVTKIENNRPPAIPSLWNKTYNEIDENFAAVQEATNTLEEKTTSLESATKEATEGSAGIVQFATSEEVKSGAESGKAISPKTFHETLGQLIPKATTAVEGKVQLATDTEAAAGTNSEKALTPANLKQFIDRGQLGTVKALGNSIDLNTLKTNGRYWVNQTGQQNGPSGTGGLVEVYTARESDNSANIIQTFISAAGDSTDCYRRTSTDGETWKAWSRDLPLTGGTVTGATTFTGALNSGSTGNLDLSTKLVKAVSISGRNITFTFNDGTTQTITTQDTTGSSGDVWTVFKGTNGWARDNTNGFTVQWGIWTNTTTSSKQVTFPRSFVTVVQVASSCSAWDAMLWNPTLTGFELSFQNSGNRWFYWVAVGFS